MDTKYGTDHQLLLAIVPELKERIENPSKELVPLIEELRHRAVDTEKGFKPFHWWRGML